MTYVYTEHEILFSFFFSSRRRHTRSTRDWSSDVCSSDLAALEAAQYAVNAASASSHRHPSPSCAAKTIPAKRRRFFVHCRGRSAIHTARARLRRGGSSRTRAVSGSVMRRMVEPRRRLLRLGRQHELEPAALARLGFELDPPAQCEGELARDRKPEARPGVVARPERAEDPFALLRRDAGPGVVDRDGDTAVLGGQPELDAYPVRRPAERVREQVRDDLEDAVSVRD